MGLPVLTTAPVAFDPEALESRHDLRGLSSDDLAPLEARHGLEGRIDEEETVVDGPPLGVEEHLVKGEAEGHVAEELPSPRPFVQDIQGLSLGVVEVAEVEEYRRPILPPILGLDRANSESEFFSIRAREGGGRVGDRLSRKEGADDALKGEKALHADVKADIVTGDGRIQEAETAPRLLVEPDEVRHSEEAGPLVPVIGEVGLQVLDPRLS